MTAQRIRAALVALAMLAALFAANALRPTVHLADSRPKVDLEAMFPKEFGGWTVDERMPVQLIAPDTQAMLNKLYNQTLSRTYVNGQGERIMLSVAYGGDQSDGTRAHRPEVCYPAQGFQIVSSRVGSQTLGAGQLPVRELVAKLGGRIEPILYWIVIGERIALSGTQQKLAQLRYSTTGVIPDGTLVRVSSIDPDTNRAFKVQSRFIADLYQAVTASSRPRLFGEAAGSQ